MVSQRERVVVGNPSDGGFLFWLCKFYLFGACAMVGGAVATVPVLYLAVASRTPMPEDLSAYADRAPMATRIRSFDGMLLTTLAEEPREFVPYPSIPPLLVKAIVAAEDKTFFEHAGIDIRGIARAAITNFRSGRVSQGGSTITQQVAKTQLSAERSLERKLRELVLARRIEARFSKEEILEFYLNQAFFGSSAYGVGSAAAAYFDKPVDRLSLAEMALLAGLVQAPSRYSPRRNIHEATQRRNYVLRRMLALGFIDRFEYTRAVGQPIRLARRERLDPFPWYAPHLAEHVRRELIERHGRESVYKAGWDVTTTLDMSLQSRAHHYALKHVGALDKRQGWRGPVGHLRSEPQRQEVLERMARVYGDSPVLSAGRPHLALITSVTPTRAHGRIANKMVVIPRHLLAWAAPYSRTDAQNSRTIDDAKQALSVGDLVWVIRPGRPSAMAESAPPSQNPPGVLVHLDQRPRVEGALLLYDHDTGYALTMVGGLDHDTSSFNRAVQACRQPGSAFKPIYYSLALDGNRFSMGSILQDKPYVPEPGEQWNPQNVHGTLDGDVTLHYSLIKSLNLPAIQLLQAVGAKATARWARRLGFSTELVADKGLALGASCVRMDELVRAFATFARGGSQRDIVYVRQLRDRHGIVVEDHTVVEDPLLSEEDRIDRMWATALDRPKQVIDARTAFLTAKLLRDSVLYGIAGRCRIVPVPTAGKGGTSSDTLDTWFVGFTSQWAAVAWVGDDTNQRPLGAKEASYTTAIPFWAEFMREATAGRPHGKTPRTIPEGLLRARIDLLTGSRPKPDQPSVEIYYRQGTYTPQKEPSDRGEG